MPAARAVTGTVFAFDIEPDMVSKTAARAAAAKVTNVVAEVRDVLAGGSGRPDAIRRMIAAILSSSGAATGRSWTRGWSFTRSGS